MKIIETPADVVSVAVSPDGRRIASVSEDGTGAVRLWDAQTGQPIVSGAFVGHFDRVIAVAFSPQGDRLATASEDNTARIWNAQTGLAVGAVMAHPGRVHGVAFSADGRRVATTCADKTVRMWDAHTGQPLGEPLVGHADALWGIAFSPDGHRLATTSTNRTVRIWDGHTALKAAAELEHDAAAWRSHHCDPAWLLTGARLTEAEELAARPMFHARLAGVRDFLSASRQYENTRGT